MTVRELIEKLQELEQNHEITVGGCEIHWISTDTDALGEEFYTIEN